MDYWLAQSNPTKFRIIEYYTKCGTPATQNSWHSRYAGRVRRGDKVFCFKSKGSDEWRGILSLEEVTCDATYGIESFAHEEPFWIDRKQKDTLLTQRGFTTRTIKAFPRSPIREGDLAEHPELRGLDIPSPLRTGILHVDKIHGKGLENLIERTRDPSRSEPQEQRPASSVKQTLCPIASNVEVMPGTHLMRIEAPDIAAAAKPGQFITVLCQGFTLRRPFSVHQSSPFAGKDSGEGQIAILFNVAGKGTLWLSQRKAGERIDVLGPLGNGFTTRPESKNLLLVAGGIGIAPLVLMIQHVSPHHQVTLIQGASTAAQLYASSSVGKRRSKVSPLPDGVRFIPVTEDGSAGHKGMATDVLPDFLDWADQVCACGPVDMYKAMADISLRAERNNLKLKRCQASLEVRMGCGFGACYGCTINTKKGLKRVCRDGPVFELQDIIWQEVRT